MGDLQRLSRSFFCEKMPPHLILLRASVMLTVLAMDQNISDFRQ